MTRRLQGSITKKKGLWYGVADLGRDSRGKRSRKWSRGCVNRRGAERELARLITTGTPTLPGRCALGSLIDDYILETESRGRQKTTVERYRSLLKNNIGPYIGMLRIGVLKAEKVNRLYADLRARDLAPTTIAHVHGLLTATLRWARRAGRMDRDPMIGVDPPRRSHSSARAMRIEDARKFFDALPQSARARWHAFFLFALATGMRRGEILALRREHVDHDRAVAIVAESLAESRGAVYRKPTKTERIREVPLSPLAVEALVMIACQRDSERAAAGDAYEDHELIFPDRLGRCVRPMAFTDAFRRAADALGFRQYTLHTLRHTAATWLLTRGADLRTTGSILGHADAATTLRVYSHVVVERQRSAVGLIGDVLRGRGE